MSTRRRIHGGLILTGCLFGASLSVLIMGASRGLANDAGLPGSAAADFRLKDAGGTVHGLGEWRPKSVVMVVARQDAADMARAAAAIEQVRKTFAHDASVQVVGVQVAANSGLLVAETPAAGVLEAACPALETLHDFDGSVARAYRVSEVPTAFVIDDHGVIRGRVALNVEGAAVAVAETVSSVRPVGVGFTGESLVR